jgi:serine/threonine protein kinase
VGQLQPDAVVGGYKLIRLLGEGGMGEVWQAHDERADRLVALKFIKPHLLSNPKTKTRFTNEAKTLGKLDHDRVVPLYSVIEEDEHLAFVLRFIDGGSLADRIERQFPLPQSFILSASRDILGALGDAHGRGIIHRDMKPQNILVDRQERAFLTDFGIAITDTQERATQGAFAIGTPHYMSPEQIARPRELTIPNGGHRTDIYSFGVVLFEMLTGQVPFGQNSGAEETFAIQQAHCVEPPPALRLLNPSISPGMEAVVLHCLEKDPNLRPQSCAALLAEIEAAAQGAPSSRPARPQTILDPTAGVIAPPLVKTGSSRTTVVEPLKPAGKANALRTKILVSAAVLLLAVGGGGAWLALRDIPKHSGSSDSNQPVEHQTPDSGSGRVTTPTSQANPKKQKTPATEVVIQKPQPTAPPLIVAPTATDPDAEAKKEAAGYAGEASQAFNDGDYCKAERSIIEAIDAYHDRKYDKLLQTYKQGCTAIH